MTSSVISQSEASPKKEFTGIEFAHKYLRVSHTELMTNSSEWGVLNQRNRKLLLYVLPALFDSSLGRSSHPGLTLERETHLEWDNLTIACNVEFVGGYCNGDQTQIMATVQVVLLQISLAVSN